MQTKARSTNKQHVVPQHYLRPFANENEKLIEYDKNAGRIFPVDVADADQKRGFLSVPELDGGERSGSFAEMYFQLYENPAAVAIRRVLAGLRTGITRLINDEISIALSLFLAVRYQPTPASRQRMYEGPANSIAPAPGKAHTAAALQQCPRYKGALSLKQSEGRLRSRRARLDLGRESVGAKAMPGLMLQK